MSYSDQHYGEGDPNCPICSGIGYIQYEVPDNDPRFGKIFACECRKGASTQQAIHLRRFGGLEHLEHKTFETFNAQGIGLTDLDQTNLRLAYDYAHSYSENLDGWLIIVGGTGCGKTHLAAAIGNSQIQKGNVAMFVTAIDLLDYLRTSYETSNQDHPYSARLESVQTTPLLIIDDLGTQSPSSWAFEKLYQILNFRQIARLPTVITTGRKIEDFEPRISSRMSDPDLSQIIVITAPDYRKATVSGASKLNSLGLHSDKTFESFSLNRNLSTKERTNLKMVYEIAFQFAEEQFIAEANSGQTTTSSNEKSKRWLILTGPSGSGKTHLAAAIGNVQVRKNTRVMFVTTADLFDYLRGTFGPDSTVSYDERFNEIKTVPLLILDDLGTEASTPWASAKLYQILNYRYIARLPTVITTVQRFEDIGKLIDERLVTRMRDQRLCRRLAILAPAYIGDESLFPN